jgi:hypothetical protein
VETVEYLCSASRYNSLFVCLFVCLSVCLKFYTEVRKVAHPSAKNFTATGVMRYEISVNMYSFMCVIGKLICVSCEYVKQ